MWIPSAICVLCCSGLTHKHTLKIQLSLDYWWRPGQTEPTDRRPDIHNSFQNVPRVTYRLQNTRCVCARLLNWAVLLHFLSPRPGVWMQRGSCSPAQILAELCNCPELERESEESSETARQIGMFLSSSSFVTLAASISVFSSAITAQLQFKSLL